MRLLLLVPILAISPLMQATMGGNTIGSSQVVATNVSSSGGVAAIRGNLDVYGTVNGDAIAIRGDVIVHPGGHVRGDAISVMGAVQNLGGTIDGRIRSYSSGAQMVHAHMRGRRFSSPFAAASAAISWLVTLLLIGIATLLIAPAQLRRVGDTLRGGVSKSFFAGIFGSLAVAPALIALVISLAVTIVGIIFIPVGIIAFLIVVLGIGTLGFLAVAQLAGTAVARGRKRDLTETGAELRSLVVGLLVFMIAWIVVGFLSPIPLIGVFARMFAVALTLAAFVTGFGAVVLTGFKKT
jgi:hypothetical protein